MTNILNSQITNTNNSIAARKLGEKSPTSRFIEAPQSLPRYSLEKVLQEKDEFRRNIHRQQYEESTKKKGSGLLKLGVLAAAIGGFILLKSKK